MKHYLLYLWIVFMAGVHAFEIDPFNPNASLTENFSTNCLQMTQSQQMLKAYLMIGLNSTFQNPKENLAKAIPAYDTRMDRVIAYFRPLLEAKNATNAIAAFEEARKLWKVNKALLEQPPTPRHAHTIRKNFLRMIDKLLEGTKPLANDDLELISLTGKLCRKPMEIANDYLLKVWGAPVANYDARIAEIIRHFHANLAILSKNPLNNDESRALLAKSEKHFMFFEFMYKSKSRFVPNLLSKKADENFAIIRQIKKIYKHEAEQRATKRMKNKEQ